MIVRLSPDAPPTLVDVDRLDRLHAECPGPLEQMATGSLCRADDDGAHVWLDIGEARVAGAATAEDPAFGDRFDAMIAFAASKGWTDEAGTHVRAHIERTEERRDV